MLPIKAAARQEKDFRQYAGRRYFFFKQAADQGTEQQQRPEADQLVFDKSNRIPGVQTKQQEKTGQNKEKLDGQPSLALIPQSIADMVIHNGQSKNNS